ncbi:hypothetical protein D3C72_1938180 [compost metagenome]
MPQQHANRLDQRRQLNPPLFQRLVPGKAEQLLGHLRTALASIEDMLKQALVALWVFAVKGQLRRTDNDGQQVVEVMSHATGQLTQGFELLCLE